jgi:hypothetical protein
VAKRQRNVDRERKQRQRSSPPGFGAEPVHSETKATTGLRDPKRWRLPERRHDIEFLQAVNYAAAVRAKPKRFEVDAITARCHVDIGGARKG